MKNGTYTDKRGDLLAVLLSDELFNFEDKMIIDECLTFFFAATQTSSMTTQNMLFYLARNQNKHLLERVRNEIDKSVIKGSNDKVENLLNYENIFELGYYSQCFSESLRIEPPVMFSSLNMFTEEV